MQIFSSIDEMRFASGSVRRGGANLGFVPTMGALHQGHLSLIRAAKSQCHKVAASIFVNPLQFGPNEDFAKYPRDFERDSEQLKNEGVDFLFAPSAQEMYPVEEMYPAEEIYPTGAVTRVVVECLSDRLCGKSRPGHFRGVATVVSKLFHIVEPNVAFFGQKDAAQIAIVRRMVRDLNFPIKIVSCPIVREPDGLAMSSRNAYLKPEDRNAALALHHCLMEVQELFQQGERNVETLIIAGRKIFETHKPARLDYLEIVDPDNLAPVKELKEAMLVAVAGFVGPTRLIDNILLNGT